MPARPPCVIWAQRGLVRLTEQLSVATDVGLRLYLPANLWSDGASVPRILRSVLEAPAEQLLVMGMIHDGAYRIDARWMLPDSSYRKIERPEADDLARAVAAWSSCTELDQRKIRWGLGAGAAGAWHNKTLDWEPA